MTRRELLLGLLAATCIAQVDRTAAGASPAGTDTDTGSGIITVRPDMIVNEIAHGDAYAMFDEAAISGDPRAGTGGHPVTAWTVDDGALYYPLTAYIDLGAPTRLTDIYIYDTNGTGDFRIFSGTPADWRPLVFDPLTNFQVWNRHPVDVRTRYLRFVIADPGTLVPGVVLYGSPAQTAHAAPDRAPRRTKPRPLMPMDQLIGTNAFIDDPVETMAAVGYIREYHDWSWDTGETAYPNNRVAFEPSRAGQGAWYFDDYYAKLKAAGLTVCPAIQGNVLWLAGSNSQMNWKVAAHGQDPANPASYAAHADEMFQYAARYGSAHVPDDLLKLTPNQPRKSGLGLLRYFENSNEPNGWWGGPHVYSRPYEFAAQCSADYDGHRGSMGRTVGVKNADPNAIMVMGGLTAPTLASILDYVKAMKAWADWHRGGSFPADVLNFHHYAGDDARMPDHPFGNGNGHSISPEEDRLVEQFRPVIEYRDRWLPQCEVWVTEFGYDTNPASPQTAPAIGDTSTEETQARWLVRSYLAFAAAGIDRVAQFMLRDVNPQDPTQFSSSGLVSPKGEWTPKPSWFYTATLKNRLRGMRFAGEAASGNALVRIYRFRSDSGSGAYAVWCPTSENATVPGYGLACPGSPSSVTCVSLTNGEVTGRAVPLQLTNGHASIDVSEAPVLILVDSMPR